MRCILSNFARILTVAGMLIFFAGPLHADPLITISAVGGANPINVGAANVEFFVGVIGNNGMLTFLYINASNATTPYTVLDLHFFSNIVQSAPWIGDLSPNFNVSKPIDRNGIVFETGPNGTGIPPGQSLEIKFSNFTPGTVITGVSTVPEPTTLLLLGTGLVGVALRARNKLKNRNVR